MKKSTAILPVLLAAFAITGCTADRPTDSPSATAASPAASESSDRTYLEFEMWWKPEGSGRHLPIPVTFTIYGPVPGVIATDRLVPPSGDGLPYMEVHGVEPGRDVEIRVLTTEETAGSLMCRITAGESDEVLAEETATGNGDDVTCSAVAP